MQNGAALKYRSVWLFVGYAIVALVVYLSLTSNPINLNLGFPNQDKVFHALAYFSLMFWFAQIYHNTRQRAVMIVVFVFLGLLMEYVQSLSPYRTAEFADMLANATGVILAYVITRQRLRFVLMRVETLLL